MAVLLPNWVLPFDSSVPVSVLCCSTLLPFLQSYTGCPLVCNNRAYGIYSYPYRQPMSFYTDISPYLPWINHVMKS